MVGDRWTETKLSKLIQSKTTVIDGYVIILHMMYYYYYYYYHKCRCQWCQEEFVSDYRMWTWHHLPHSSVETPNRRRNVAPSIYKQTVEGSRNVSVELVWENITRIDGLKNSTALSISPNRRPEIRRSSGLITIGWDVVVVCCGAHGGKGRWIPPYDRPGPPLLMVQMTKWRLRGWGGPTRSLFLPRENPSQRQVLFMTGLERHLSVARRSRKWPVNI